MERKRSTSVCVGRMKGGEYERSGGGEEQDANEEMKRQRQFVQEKEQWKEKGGKRKIPV